MDSKSQSTKTNLPDEEQRHERDNSLDRDDELPTYEDSAPGPSHQPSQLGGSTSSSTLGPTISAPFNFPSINEAPPPPDYSSPSASQRPIAIPQQWPGAAAPFLPAYAPVLLNYGIPASSWYSFLDTASAFLTAKVGKRAVSHAGDIAASVGRVPKQFGKDVANTVKDTFRDIGHNVKKGNPLGVVGGVIGGTVGLTVGTATRAIGSIFSLPGTAIAAGASPKTPLERAQAYAQAANKDWFHKRALHAHVMSTAEVANLAGVSLQQLLDTVHSQPNNAGSIMTALRDLIESVELRHNSPTKPEATPELSPSGFPADDKKPIEPDEFSAAGPSASSSSQSGPSNQPKNTDALQITEYTFWLVLLRDDPQDRPGKEFKR